MNKNENMQGIIRRLDVIIGLLLDFNNLLSAKYEIEAPEKFKMARLKKLGLENQEIALLFNTSKRRVSKQIYETKRSGKKKRPKSQRK